MTSIAKTEELFSEGGKVCNECGEWKHLQSFTKTNRGKGKKPRRIGICRKCKLKRPHVRESLNKAAAKCHQKRYRKVIWAKGSHTVEQWNEVLSKYGNSCLCCGTKELVQKDHIIPIGAIGWSNDISNLQPLCQRCNSLKSHRVIDFRPELSSLFGITRAKK